MGYGDFEKGIQPEEVYYFPKVVEYKALWDVDQNWDIHATPVDKQKPDELKKQKPDEDKKKKERKEIEITKTVTVANLRRHLIVGILHC